MDKFFHFELFLGRGGLLLEYKVKANDFASALSSYIKYLNSPISKYATGIYAHKLKNGELNLEVIFLMTKVNGISIEDMQKENTTMEVNPVIPTPEELGQTLLKKYKDKYYYTVRNGIVESMSEGRDSYLFRIDDKKDIMFPALFLELEKEFGERGWNLYHKLTELETGYEPQTTKGKYQRITWEGIRR